MRREDDLTGMTAIEALHAGLVQRVVPHYVCASRSPESDLPCELEPGHEQAHHAHRGRSSTSAWAHSAEELAEGKQETWSRSRNGS